MKYKSHGFTIVELLIVIVIIGILATIVIVAYNGITKKAQDATLQSDLKNANTTLEIANAADGTYPADASSLKHGSDTVFNYKYNSSDNSYCLQASSTKTINSYYITSGGNIQTGTCVPATPLTMQTMTASYCSSMTVYTGSNPSSLLTLTDNRDGTTRNYTIGKLADNNCWMLDNLKLGSTTGTITLTPADSNVATNFILPQVTTSAALDTSSNPGNNYDTPYAYGPVPGDTGSGTTNYGYLYNFAAATAGETRTSLPAGTTNASFSICPKGWRLPIGRQDTGDFSILDKAMGGTGANQSSNPTAANRWLLSSMGPVRGVFAGYWYGGFGNYGLYGYLWSSSAVSSVNSAWDTSFNGSNVNPGTVSSIRNYGFGVRCLLN